MATRALWIGTYPPAGIGTPTGLGEGLYRVDLAGDGSLSRPRRVVRTPAPSFVVRHPSLPVLYATDESEAGRVAAFRVHDEGLEPLGTASSGGTYPCHLLVDGDRLCVANYGDGTLGVLALAPDGSFASDEPVQVLRHAGSGPRADRQEGPHAHFVVRGPGGHVLVVDLGADEVRRYRRTAGGLEPAGVAVTLPPGTGPRHLAFDGGFAYLSGELDVTVRVLAWDATTDTGAVVQTVPAVANGRLGAEGGHGSSPAAPTPSSSGGDGDLRAVWAAGGELLPSHLALDGDELVVGVRGAQVLARFTVGADGLLTHRADLPLPGRTPRHFVVVGSWTVVAEQEPGAVTVLDRDGDVVSSCAVPSAACVVPAV